MHVDAMEMTTRKNDGVAGLHDARQNRETMHLKVLNSASCVVELPGVPETGGTDQKTSMVLWKFSSGASLEFSGVYVASTDESSKQ